MKNSKQGLVSEVAAAGAMPPAGEPAGEAAVPGEQPASSDEQGWYDAVQRAGAEILFDNDEASTAVLRMINPDSPAVSAGTAAAEVMIRIDQGMDGEVPEGVILPAAAELLGHVLDIGEAAGLLQRSAELDEEATQAMVARLADEYGIDEAAFQQAQQLAPGMTGGAANGQ